MYETVLMRRARGVGENSSAAACPAPAARPESRHREIIYSIRNIYLRRAAWPAALLCRGDANARSIVLEARHRRVLRACDERAGTLAVAKYRDS